MTKQGDESQHRFGGDWTTTKLRILQSYLRAYTTALKKQPFTKVYIDAFAGTGYRTESRETAADGRESSRLLFPDLADEEPQALLRVPRRSRCRPSRPSIATCSSSGTENIATSWKR